MVKSKVRFKNDLCWDLKENIFWEIIYIKKKITLPPVQFLKLGSKNYCLRKIINSFFKNKINVRKKKNKKEQKRTKNPPKKPQIPNLKKCDFSSYLFLHNLWF